MGKGEGSHKMRPALAKAKSTRRPDSLSATRNLASAALGRNGGYSTMRPKVMS
jgi:hypothetical protein